MNYLTHDQLEMALSGRRAVEQWLGVREDGGRRVIRWVRIEPRKAGGYVVRIREVFDTGNDHFFDVSEFEPIDLDEPEGIVKNFDDWQSALAHASSLGAAKDRFFPHGRIQDVYRDFRQHGRN